MIYMFCYDISDPKRLRKSAKILENYGIRVQLSFFQCEMKKQMMEELKEDLLSVINTKEDFLFVYPLCDDCSNSVYTDGTGDVIRISTFEIL